MKLYNINIFNFLRGCAALFVLMFHVYLILNLIYPNIKLAWIGATPAWVGVWIFFMLSGYLIGKAFFLEKYKTDSILDFLNFYLQRAIRILPIYFFIVFLDIFFVNTNVYVNNFDALRRVLFFSINTSGPTAMVGNLWFICSLIFLYLITPFVHKFVIKPISNLNKKNVVLGFIVITLLCVEFLLRKNLFGHINWSQQIYSKWFFNIDLYIGSFIFAYITQWLDIIPKLKKILKPLSIIIFVIFTVAECYLMSKHWMLDVGAEDLKVYTPTITFIIISLIFLAFDNEVLNLKISIINPIKWVEGVGVISMGFFVSHCQTISALASNININNATKIFINCFDLLPIKITLSASCKEYIIVAVLSLFASVVWGLIIFYCIEKPLNKFRKSICLRRNNNAI